MKLNLGSNDKKLPGFMSVDLVPPADFVCDLREPWSIWPDSSVDEIVASHIIEHLPNRIHTMNEMHRVLKPGARAVIDVPSASHGAGYAQDPTHCAPWTMNSFLYFDDRERNWQKFNRYYGITAKLRVVEWSERCEGRNIHKYEDVYVLHVVLQAVKP